MLHLSMSFTQLAGALREQRRHGVTLTTIQMGVTYLSTCSVKLATELRMSARTTMILKMGMDSNGWIVSHYMTSLVTVPIDMLWSSSWPLFTTSVIKLYNVTAIKPTKMAIVTLRKSIKWVSGQNNTSSMIITDRNTTWI